MLTRDDSWRLWGQGHDAGGGAWSSWWVEWTHRDLTTCWILRVGLKSAGSLYTAVISTSGGEKLHDQN